MEQYCINQISTRKEESMNDYSVYKDEHTITPPQVKNYFDLGYHGIENYFPDLKAITSKKET